MGPIAVLFGFTVRQLLVSRRILLTLLILMAPGALLIVIRLVEPDEPEARELWELYNVSAHIFLMSVLVPLICIVHGTALIGAEAEARTITYLITRRMRRATVLLVKFIATWLVLALLCDIAMICLHFCAVAGCDVPSIVSESSYEGWSATAALGWYLLLIPLTVLAFLAIFTLIGLLTARPLAVSIFYLIAVELIVSNIPLRARTYSITHQLRATAASVMPRLPDLFELPRELRAELFPVGGTGLPELIVIVLVALALAALLMTMRELIPTRVSRE